MSGRSTAVRSIVPEEVPSAVPAGKPGTGTGPGPGPGPGTGPGTGTVVDRLARAVVRGAGRLAAGAVAVDEPGAPAGAAKDEPAGRTAAARVVVHDRRAYRAVVRHGSVGLAQSYVDGWWDSDDLTALVQQLVRARGGAGRARDRVGALTSPVLDPWRRLRRQPKDRDRRHIAAHYDIGNDFFALMLDPTMSYSCAVFERPDATLEEAQTAKLERICRKLDLQPSDHVVEIGTGWGGFAVHAASRHGCRVTTTTISAEQHAFATRRVAAAGLSHLVTVHNEDWRDLSGRFDKLVSVEMIEAVDWRQHHRFFRACADRLAPDGLMALQAITIDDRSYRRAKDSRDFIKALVFPGGCIPSVEALVAAAAAAGLRVVDLEDIGRHYAETLRRWRANVEDHMADVERLGLGTRFQRLWRLYLSYCEAAFLERHISDVQVVVAKGGWRAPLSVRP